MFNFTVLCILYGKNPSESNTLFSLSLVDTAELVLRLVVVNNGPTHLSKSSVCELHDKLDKTFSDVCILDNPINESMSAIYNSIIARYGNDSNFICLFDDDSVIPEKFFVECQSSAKKYPEAGLFVPLVNSNGVVVSPSNAFGKRMKSLNIGFLDRSNKYLRCIGSGMVIKCNTYRLIRFNEAFRFYGADTNYFLDVLNSNIPVCLMPTALEHSVSTNETRREALSDFKYQSLIQSAVLIMKRPSQSAFLYLRFLLWLAIKQSFYKKNIGPLIKMGKELLKLAW